MKIVCLVPARNEAATLPDCIAALRCQTSPLDEIVVSVDPSTDETLELALGLGVQTLEGPGAGSKAHNLNQALATYLPDLADEDAVLVVDADSYLDPHFVENAVRHLGRRRNRNVAALGGTFRGRPEGTYWSFCQRSEYFRYARDNARKGGQVLTLSGTAMVIRAGALRALRERYGRFYSTDSLTEDLQLSCELMRAGYDVLAPQDLTLTTETMRTLRQLYRQRLRWREGAVRTCALLGWGRGTRELALRLAWSLVGICVTALYVFSIFYTVFAGGIQAWWLFLTITAIFSIEQAVTVWKRGGWLRALAGAAIVVEMPYLIALQMIYGWAYLCAVFASRYKRSW